MCAGILSKPQNDDENRQTDAPRRAGVGMPDDATIGADFRAWVGWWALGGREDLESLFDEIVRAGQTGFPTKPALLALSKLEPRTLWKTFADEDLQDLHDCCRTAGMPAAAGRFLEAARQAPILDDGKIPRKLREQVLERAGHRCQICGTTSHLSIDHKLTPWSEGGGSRDPDNLQVLCISCNSRKGARAWLAVPDEQPKQSRGSSRR